MPLSRRLLCAFLVLSLAVGGLPAALAAAPLRVVVSIKPLHALVAGVMGDVGVPRLLLQGAASPHSYSLRPSDAQALSKADVVFWVGPRFETFLVKPLQTLAGRARVLALADAPGVEKLPYGAAGLDAVTNDAATRDDDNHDHGHEHDSGSFDPHVWLDPRNAEAMVTAIALTLAEADPEHAAAYRANAATLRDDLVALTQELTVTLAPVRARPFLVFHDAYGYLEQRFGLTSVGAIAINPERPPGAARVAEIRQRVEDQGVVCVFSEPQFPPKLVAVMTEGTRARTGVLDPVGAALPAGPEAYGLLLRGLAANLRSCLSFES